MGKKGGIVTSQMFKIILVLLVIFAIVAVINNSYLSSTRVSDNLINKHLDDLKEKESFESRMKGFENVRDSGNLNDRTISKIEDFTDFILRNDDDFNSTKGYLIIRNRLERTESEDSWTVNFHTFTTTTGAKGIMVYFDNGIRQYVLKKPSENNLYLYHRRLCVIPSDGENDDAKKLLSYITQLTYYKTSETQSSSAIIQQEDLDEIISRNIVDSVSFTIGGDSSRIIYKKNSQLVSQEFSFKDDMMMMFYKDDTVCFFPVNPDPSSISSFFHFFSGRSWNGVTFTNPEKISGSVLIGTGNIDGRLELRKIIERVEQIKKPQVRIQIKKQNLGDQIRIKGE